MLTRVRYPLNFFFSRFIALLMKYSSSLDYSIIDLQRDYFLFSHVQRGIVNFIF